MSYEGWKNYETWCVKLWIDNEQGAYEYWREQTREVGADGASTLARQLKGEFEDMAPELDGMWADLMSAALSEVDWYEIAEAMIGDEEFDDDDDDDSADDDASNAST